MHIQDFLFYDAHMNPNLIVIIFFILHWYASVFMQSFYLHRFCSHELFKLNAFWNKAFHILTIFIQGPSALNPHAYGLLHKEHHQFSDTDEDPHSPVVYNTPTKLMMRTLKVYQKHLQDPDLHKKTPHILPLKRLDDLVEKMWFRVFLGTLITLFYIAIQPHPLLFLLCPLHWFLGPIHGFIVNWCGHKYGYRNFKLPDHSKNSLPVDVLMVGELYQNNHHQHANDLNFAKKWFEFDPTYFVIKILNKFRILKLKF